MTTLIIRYLGVCSGFFLIIFAWIILKPSLDPIFGQPIKNSTYYFVIIPLAWMGGTLLVPIKIVKNKLRWERILIFSYVATLTLILGSEIYNSYDRVTLPWWLIGIVALNMFCVIYHLRFKATNNT